MTCQQATVSLCVDGVVDWGLGLDQEGVVPSVAKKIGKKLLREVFSKFFGHAGAPMHKTKNRGHRDLSVVKFSARCDAWSSKKREKNENCGNRQNLCKNQ